MSSFIQLFHETAFHICRVKWKNKANKNYEQLQDVLYHF